LFVFVFTSLTRRINVNQLKIEDAVESDTTSVIQFAEVLLTQISLVLGIEGHYFR
jgi:hypothetical protein